MWMQNHDKYQTYLVAIWLLMCCGPQSANMTSPPINYYWDKVWGFLLKWSNNSAQYQLTLVKIQSNNVHRLKPPCAQHGTQSKPGECSLDHLTILVGNLGSGLAPSDGNVAAAQAASNVVAHWFQRCGPLNDCSSAAVGRILCSICSRTSMANRQRQAEGGAKLQPQSLRAMGERHLHWRRQRWTRVSLTLSSQPQRGRVGRRLRRRVERRPRGMQDHRRHGGRAEGGRGRMSRHGETVNSEAMVEWVTRDQRRWATEIKSSFL